MKILHISVSDKIGGAAIAAFRLNRAMLAAGWNSKLLVLYKRSIDEDVISVTKYGETIYSLPSCITSNFPFELYL